MNSDTIEYIKIILTRWRNIVYVRKQKKKSPALTCLVWFDGVLKEV